MIDTPRPTRQVVHQATREVVRRQMATPTPESPPLPARYATRRNFTDCSPRSVISASRCLRCAASDPTLTQDGSSHAPRWTSRPDLT